MRKSVSVSFFSTMALLLIFGVVIMGVSQIYLFQQYFVETKFATLDEAVNVATCTIEQLPNDKIENGMPPKEVVEEDNDFTQEFKLIRDSAEVGLFVVDLDGNVVTSSVSVVHLNSEKIDSELFAEIKDSTDQYYHHSGTLGGLLSNESYVSVSEVITRDNVKKGYLFVFAPSTEIMTFLEDMCSNFLLSASLMFLFASILTMVFTNRLAAPLQELIIAAQKFGGGDLTTRVEVRGDDEIAQLASNFNIMAANLQEIDNSRSQFTGNIAHELRTPMTSIKGFVDGMIDGTIPENEQKKYLKVVSEETGRLARLVQNMLDISKLESGEYQLHARLYPIEETLMTAALSAEQRITSADIEVEGLSMDKTLVYADPDMVHQVVYNLIDNAIKFTPKGGVIKFSVLALGPEVEISIENTGEGISKEALPFVFQRFYKEDTSRGLNARGSGLGLHICKVLITLSGGQIKVESEQGKWCRFTFTLPSEMPNKSKILKIPG